MKSQYFAILAFCWKYFEYKGNIFEKCGRFNGNIYNVKKYIQKSIASDSKYNDVCVETYKRHLRNFYCFERKTEIFHKSVRKPPTLLRICSIKMSITEIEMLFFRKIELFRKIKRKLYFFFYKIQTNIVTEYYIYSHENIEFYRR